jgi:hypothetical protein
MALTKVQPEMMMQLTPAIMPTGSVIQTVNATYAVETATSSSSWTSTGLTATITPTSATSKILILVNTQIQIDTSATICGLTIFKGTTSGTNLGNASYGFAYQYNAGASSGSSATPTYLDSPATSSAQQYTVAFRSTNGSTAVYSNVGNTKSSITLMEIKV